MGSALFAFFSSVIRVPVMRSTPFTLLARVICAPVLGRAYSATPTLFHSGLYEKFYGNWRAKFPIFCGTERIISFWLADLFKMILQHVMRLAANSLKRSCWRYNAGSRKNETPPFLQVKASARRGCK